MPLDIPFYTPQLPAGNTVPVEHSDFLGSVEGGYKLGQILAGIPQQLAKTQLAQQQQNLAQQGQLFPSELAKSVAAGQEATTATGISSAEGPGKIAAAEATREGAGPLAKAEQDAQFAIAKRTAAALSGNSSSVQVTPIYDPQDPTKLLGHEAYDWVTKQKWNIPLPTNVNIGTTSDGTGVVQVPSKGNGAPTTTQLPAGTVVKPGLAIPPPAKPIGYALNPATGQKEPVIYDRYSKQQKFADGSVFSGIPEAAPTAMNASDDEIQAAAQDLADYKIAPSQLNFRSARDKIKALTLANTLHSSATGEPYNAALADQYNKEANNPQQRQNIRYVNTLIGDDNKGGTLKILEKYSAMYPRTQFPALNDLKAWKDFQTGSDPNLIKFKQAALDNGEIIGRVLQGANQTSDNKLHLALGAFSTSLSGANMLAAIQTAREVGGERKYELYQGNPFMVAAFGKEAVAAKEGNPQVEQSPTSGGQPKAVPSKQVIQDKTFGPITITR